MGAASHNFDLLVSAGLILRPRSLRIPSRDGSPALAPSQAQTDRASHFGWAYWPFVKNRCALFQCDRSRVREYNLSLVLVPCRAFANPLPPTPVYIWIFCMMDCEQAGSWGGNLPSNQLDTTDALGMTLVMHAARSGNVAILGAVLRRIINLDEVSRNKELLYGVRCCCRVRSLNNIRCMVKPLAAATSACELFLGFLLVIPALSSHHGIRVRLRGRSTPDVS